MKIRYAVLGLAVLFVVGAVAAWRYQARQNRIEAMAYSWSEDKFYPAVLHCFAVGTPYFGVPCDEVGQAYALRDGKGAMQAKP